MSQHFKNMLQVLADARHARHGAARAAQLKSIFAELRKVCNHPYLLPDFEPDSLPGVAAGAAGRSDGSAAVQVCAVQVCAVQVCARLSGAASLQRYQQPTATAGRACVRRLCMFWVAGALPASGITVLYGPTYTHT